MNIFTILFLQNFNKIFSKTHQIAPFLKNFSGSIPPDPPSMQIQYIIMQIPPLFQKYFEPPPQKNKILDTPLKKGL